MIYTCGNFGSNYHPVYIGEKALNQLSKLLTKNNLKDIFIVSSPLIWSLYGNKIKAELKNFNIPYKFIEIPDGESAKNLQTVEYLYDKLLAEHLERRSTIIAFGGGVIGDIAGFTAATILRGINLVQIPTTLIAQADSSIGGKTGINFKGKNLVGAFYNPVFVLSDLSLLETLPEKEWRSGMAEIIKSAIIGSKKLFHFLERNKTSISQNSFDLIKTVVTKAVLVKTKIVKQDPFEYGIRKILNLGHTFGHAIEYAANYSLSHGEALSIGMVAACRLAHKLHLTSRTFLEKIVHIFKLFNLPVAAPLIDIPTLLNALALDKKREEGSLKFVVPIAIGKIAILKNTPRKIILEVIEETLQQNRVEKLL